MSKLYNTKFKPTKKGIVEAAVDFVIKKIRRKKKVSPDIKSLKPTKLSTKKSLEKTRGDAYSKNIKNLDAAEKKIKEGKKMMKEGVKSRKQMTGTGRAFQFEGSKSYHAIRPGDKELYGKQMKVEKTKKFKTTKQMEKDERRKKEKEPFMGGGMAGRRFGYSQGKLAETPREKQLAAQYGDKKRITRGDVITIAKKKSGEEPLRDRMKQPLKRKKP